MSFDEKFADGLKELASKRKATEVIPIMVMSVDEDKMTVDGMDQDSVDHFDIRIQASEGVQEGAFVIPAEGSWILASNIGKDETTYFAVATSLVKGAIVKIGDLEVEVNVNGIAISKGFSDLKTTMDDLIAAIKAITVPTSQGPSGTPINFAQFDQVKAKLNQLLR